MSLMAVGNAMPVNKAVITVIIYMRCFVGRSVQKWLNFHDCSFFWGSRAVRDWVKSGNFDDRIFVSVCLFNDAMPTA